MLATATEGRVREGIRPALWRMTTTASEPAARRDARIAKGDPIRVFLVADVCVYRELLVDALATQESLEVVGHTPADIAAVAVGMSQPAVVLVDTSSGGGLARVQALTAAVPAAKIVAVAIPDDEKPLLELVEAGVAGFVTAEQPLEELVDVIEAASKGELKCSPRVAAALAQRVATLRANGSPESDRHRLTRREREIAALIAQGLSNKQIASRLSIERATVKNHVHKILSKLGVSRRDEVAALVRTSMLTVLATAGTMGLWAATLG